MERFFALFALGIKYLYRYRRRYGFLLAALVFGFAVVTLISSAKDGMSANVYYSAQSHYAGDIVALGYEAGLKDRHLGQDEIAAILEAADEAGFNPLYTVKRTLFGERGVVYHNGAAVQLKYVIGSDWEKEAHLFNKMTFDGAPELPAGDDGIVISTPVAKQLGARLGDSLILETETGWGQKNTGVFIVRGIVQDTSIFGYYKVYVSRKSLNRLMGFGIEDCSNIGFFIANPGAAEQQRRLFQEILADYIQTGPLVYNRDELERETTRPWEGTRVFLYTMPVYLSEVSDLLDAMNIIGYFLYGMMLLIILVSAAVTYRLILHERSKEMGVMRAIGFYGGDLRMVLWAEVFALGCAALLAGFLLSLFLGQALAFLSFSWLPGFEMFMKDGKLMTMYLPKTMMINIVSVFVVLFAATLAPAFRSSQKSLPGLLSGEEL
ncbi:MAG: FtsX-like permease family protein [Treponema sp.]|jgi:ABC-type lipoprotein release transport system permease subunit|nr:FtsX-like permease family protein [Treponema sp.]